MTYTLPVPRLSDLISMARQKRLATESAAIATIIPLTTLQKWQKLAEEMEERLE